MNPEAASWAGLAAGSPLVLVALCWSLVILHAHRPLWRAVDVFIAAILGQGCARQILALAISLLQLLGAPNAANGIACSSAIWAITSLHVLHAATLASLVLDRALSLKWPRRYKRHPRRDHARYHVSVLTVIAGFVGLAAVFARPQFYDNENKCSFLPHELEPKFALFAATLHAVLFICTIVGAIVVQIRRYNRRSPSLLRSTSDLRALAQSDTSTSSTASGRGRFNTISDGSDMSKPALLSSSAYDGGEFGKSYGSSLLSTYYQQNNPNWLESHKNRIALPERLRWPTVVSILSLCYLIHHLPLLVVTILGSLYPELLPDWPFDSLALWAGLAQDCLLPICLALCDANFAPWVARIYRRNRHRHGIMDDKLHISTSSIYSSKNADFKTSARLLDLDPNKFPLTNGSLFSGHSTSIANNYQRGRGIVRYSRTACMGITAREIRGYISHNNILEAKQASINTPTVQETNEQKHISSTTWEVKKPSIINTRQVLSNVEPEPKTKALQITKQDIDSSDEDPVYASLSEDLASLGDDLASRCCSVTTAANDDFVFHPGPKHNEKYSSSSSSSTTHSISSSSLTSSDDELKKEIKIEPRRQRIRPRFYNSTCKILDTTSSSDTSDDEKNKDVSENLKLKQKLRHSHTTSGGSNNNNSINQKNIIKETKNKVSASYSMNDLDRIEVSNNDKDQDLDIVFELPVKSESILSLYRLQYENNNLTRVASDNNNVIMRKSSFNQRPQPKRIPSRYLHNHSHIHHLHNANHSHSHHHHHHHHQPHQLRNNLHINNKNSVSVVSMDSLHSALAREYSYLDSGEVYRHNTASYPDLQRIFVSDFI